MGKPIKSFCFLCLAVLSVIFGCRKEFEAPPVEESVHSFYYGWYANEATDGSQAHWNHDVLGVDDAPAFPGGNDIGANYYPQLGTYSSRDPHIIKNHLSQHVTAGIGVMVVSWWGEGTYEDKGIPQLLDLAADYGIKLAFHLEPFPGRNVETSRDAIAYLLDRYGSHPSIYRAPEFGNRPMLYVYDSYLTDAGEWRRLLHPDGDITIRNTPLDVVMIGLWVNQPDSLKLLDSEFDGWYTYFASDGFTYGSTLDHWTVLAECARRHDKIFIPCVGPGYIDTRIRPWNSPTTRSREDGEYYDRMFKAALAVKPPVVGITSFNEWHEGTQIEPAIPKTVGEYTYEDYTPLEPDYYLKRTRHWVDEFMR